MIYASRLSCVFLLWTLNLASSHAQILTSSNLPIIIINSGAPIPDEPKITATMKIIDNPNGMNEVETDTFAFEGTIGVEIRGQSSQSFPKHGYGVETRDENGDDHNVSLLGMPKESDWVIHSPYSDKSLIRNAMAYSIAGELMAYAPRVRMAEAIINNDYLGVVLWTEKIKRDKNRVDISKLKKDDNEGDKLTGGYIIKFDKGDEVGWESKYRPISGQSKKTRFLLNYPKISKISDPQRAYIKSYIDEFEDVLMSENYTDSENGYAKYIDVGSFVNTIILNELTRNVDGYRLSTYMYKDRDSKGGKLAMGPTWDHNLAWGNAVFCVGSNTAGWGYEFNNVCPDDYWVNHVWWERLLSDDNFKKLVKKRWQSLREGILSTSSLHQRVDDYVTLLEKPQERNFKRWSVLDEYVWPNNFVGDTYEREIEYLKNWIEDRTVWLDKNFDSLTAVRDIANVTETMVSPNPASQFINITSDIPLRRIDIFEMSGRHIVSHSLQENHSTIDISGINSKGALWYRLVTQDGEIITGKIVVH